MITVADLKVIRLALNNAPLSTPVLTAIKNVDEVLAKHNLRINSKSKPKRPYQRQVELEYFFETIK